MEPRELTVEQQLEWLCAGTADVVPRADLAAKLERSRRTGQPLRVKLGMDPTAPDLHLGHSVVMRKLRQFQQLGHEVNLVIGDFTALIGDPSGRSETRKPLTLEEIGANAQTYQEQAYKIIDPERSRIVFNNDWLGPLRFADVVQLSSRFTVARLLERDDFSNRFAEGRPIAVHEFMYAFAQAYDSVHLRADVELGGTDQRFNLLMGRDIQTSYGQEPQVAVLMPILVGLDGSQKMSKSLGNYVGVMEPAQTIFEKLMSISDAMLSDYYALLTDLPAGDYAELVRAEPMEAKKQLAGRITATYHDEAAAVAARAEWERVHSARKLPSEVPEILIPADALNEHGRIWLARLLTLTGLAQGTREARRLIEDRAVSVDGERITDPNAGIEVREGMVVQVGRRKFARLRLP